MLETTASALQFKWWWWGVECEPDSPGYDLKNKKPADTLHFLIFNLDEDMNNRYLHTC